MNLCYNTKYNKTILLELTHCAYSPLVKLNSDRISTEKIC